MDSEGKGGGVGAACRMMKKLVQWQVKGGRVWLEGEIRGKRGNNNNNTSNKIIVVIKNDKNNNSSSVTAAAAATTHSSCSRCRSSFNIFICKGGKA